MLIVHYAGKTDPGAGTATSVGLQRRILDPAEPIPAGAIWIDMVEPTVDEDRKVEGYLGSKVPSRSDPDFAQPAESYYAENGVRYLHACVVSEAEGTPDVADVTFILGPPTQLHAKFVAIASVIAHSTLRPGDVVDATVPGELAITGGAPS